MNIAIYGAGAIGGWMGARLGLHTPHSINVVARGANLTALQSNGLSFIDSDGKQHPIKVNASANPSDLGQQDIIIVAVKAQSMPQVAQAIAPLIGPNTLIVSAMNGVPWWFFEGFGGQYQNRSLSAVDPSGSIKAAIPGHQIIGCVVHASCATPNAGVVKQNFGNKLIIGEPNGKASSRLQALAQLFEQAKFETVISDQIQRDIWFKLWGNMTVNPISAFTGTTTDKILDDDLVRGFISAVMLEAKEIGAEFGIAIDQTPEDRHAVTRKLGSFKPSMLQDVEAGKAIELDALVTVVKELGKITGKKTPYTDALLGLSRLFAIQRGLYEPAVTS